MPLRAMSKAGFLRPMIYQIGACVIVQMRCRPHRSRQRRSAAMARSSGRHSGTNTFQRMETMSPQRRKTWCTGPRLGSAWAPSFAVDLHNLLFIPKVAQQGRELKPAVLRGAGGSASQLNFYIDEQNKAAEQCKVTLASLVRARTACTAAMPC